MRTQVLKADYDYLAPDTSEIRLLPTCSRGGICHCRLQPGVVTHAVKHKTVQEIWYVIAGRGEIWRKCDEIAHVTELTPGTSVTIEPDTVFQFRATGTSPLDMILVTMPPWPGPQEAVACEGLWPRDGGVLNP